MSYVSSKIRRSHVFAVLLSMEVSPSGRPGLMSLVSGISRACPAESAEHSFRSGIFTESLHPFHRPNRLRAEIDRHLMEDTDSANADSTEHVRLIASSWRRAYWTRASFARVRDVLPIMSNGEVNSQLHLPELHCAMWLSAEEIGEHAYQFARSSYQTKLSFATFLVNEKHNHV